MAALSLTLPSPWGRGNARLWEGEELGVENLGLCWFSHGWVVSPLCTSVFTSGKWGSHSAYLPVCGED